MIPHSTVIKLVAYNKHAGIDQGLASDDYSTVFPGTVFDRNR